MNFDEIKKFTIKILSRFQRHRLEGVLRALFNRCDELENEVKDYSEENKKLKDEIMKLKGEKGRPDVKEGKDCETGDGENKKDKEGSQRGKVKGEKDIKANRVIDLGKDIMGLPKDAEYKGSRSIIIQDIRFDLDNVEFILHKFYSSSKGKCFESELPPEYKLGQYGPGIWSFIIQFHYEGRLTQNIIHKILIGIGVQISGGEISNIIRDHGRFEEEKKLTREAGIEKSTYTQIDDTGARLNGRNGFCISTCNENFADYLTDFFKNRHSALKALNGGELQYCINAVAVEYIGEKISNTFILRELEKKISKRLFSEEEFDFFILGSEWMKDKIQAWKRHVKEGCAIGAYRGNFLSVRNNILICDDAPQFKGILEYLGLCWIHEERHYKKLTPMNLEFQKILDDFRETFWKFYDELKKYKENPSSKMKKKLEERFNNLFQQETNYYALNKLIKKTYAKKSELLLVLDYPEIPLHNNACELGVREKVVQRKIRGYFKSLQGAKASDSFLSLLGTCRKLKISFGKFIKDRYYHRYEIPPLADLIWMS